MSLSHVFCIRFSISLGDHDHDKESREKRTKEEKERRERQERDRKDQEIIQEQTRREREEMAAAASIAAKIRALRENCDSLKPRNPRYIESRPIWKEYICLLEFSIHSPDDSSTIHTVKVAGEWDEWSRHIPLVRDKELNTWRWVIPKPHPFSTPLNTPTAPAPLPPDPIHPDLRAIQSTEFEGLDILSLLSGQLYQFKFIINDIEWRVSRDLPLALDDSGNLNNQCVLGEYWGW